MYRSGCCCTAGLQFLLLDLDALIIMVPAFRFEVTTVTVQWSVVCWQDWTQFQSWGDSHSCQLRLLSMASAISQLSAVITDCSYYDILWSSGPAAVCCDTRSAAALEFAEEEDSAMMITAAEVQASLQDTEWNWYQLKLNCSRMELILHSFHL